MYKNFEYVKNKLARDTKPTTPAPDILCRYSPPEVPRRIIHQVIAKAMSIFDNHLTRRCRTTIFRRGAGVILALLVFIDLFATAAEAKICFLPDDSCGTSKITSIKTNKSGCMYKSETEARNGIGACETTYKQNMCYYRRCKTEDNNIFADAESCKKKAEDSNQLCVSCGSCYKIVAKIEPKVTCTETESTCSAKGKAFEANGNYDSNNIPCGSCKPIEQPTAQTCKQINQTYKTSCSAGESLIATGERGSDGVCVTCGVCKTGNVKETKYLYFLDELVATNSEGGTLNLVEFWTSDEDASPSLYGNTYVSDHVSNNDYWCIGGGCNGHHWQLTYKGNWDTIKLPDVNTSNPVNFYYMPEHLTIIYNKIFPWANGAENAFENMAMYSLHKSAQSYNTTALCDLKLVGPFVDYQIKCVTSRDDIKISEKICEKYGFSKNSQNMQCGDFDGKCYTESCPNHPEYKKRMPRELFDGCATFIEEKEGCTSCKDGYLLENNFCRKVTECRCEKKEYINGGRGSICVQCPTGCQLINYRCLK